ncbi:MAG: mechanosensitive ion channel protein MscS, partial [Lentisphaeria bacterium]
MDLLLTIWETSLFTLADGHAIRVSQVALALLFLVAGFLLVSLFTKILSRKLLQRQVPEAAVHLAEKVIFYLLVIAVIFSALRILAIPLTMFAFLGGALAIGAG